MFHEFDLHIQTPFSDGQWDLESLIQGLIEIGIKVAAFADHVFPMAMYKHGPELYPSGLTNGFSKHFLRYRKGYIQYLDKKYPQIHLLCSGEIDLYPNGRLSLPKGIIPSDFDILMVAKHHTAPKPLNLWKKFPKLDRLYPISS